jgi:hypothetical protein
MAHIRRNHVCTADARLSAQKRNSTTRCKRTEPRLTGTALTDRRYARPPCLKADIAQRLDDVVPLAVGTASPSITAAARVVPVAQQTLAFATSSEGRTKRASKVRTGT